ncbi:MBL fold metallo-hydrolase RNA specificity domain-containing protein [Aestuariivivens sediminis]|uniref:MBL fold metallo-hydrolase RNA specificity domain-containing protein n=1 Tax=Aestuariivivens sediminis TaxID=2913557 RepID=UPI003B84854F
MKINNKYYDIKSQIHHIEILSAHTDQKGLIDWCNQLEIDPEKVFLIHGEPSASDCLREKLQDIY